MSTDDTTVPSGITLQCGWGRLIFAHTFPDPQSVAECILNEKEGERDIAFYLTDPHIVLNTAPQALFLDPSHSFRIEFSYYQKKTEQPMGFRIGGIESREDLDAVNRIYRTLNMVPVDTDYIWEKRDEPGLRYIVARHNESGVILGVAMGVDHCAFFPDIQNGSSLWSLAVDPQADLPGIGEWLVRHLVEYFQSRGRSQMDLSVMHDNRSAIGRSEKLGFKRVAIFAVKRCNPINEQLFVRKPANNGFNPYAQIIVDEALRRGIEVQPLNPRRGYFRLTLGGRSVVCRESLTDQTSAIALSRCDDKELTRSIMNDAGLKTPAQQIAGSHEADKAFLKQYGHIVVKPARGEQGRGIAVDITSAEDMEAAIVEARKEDETVLLEQYVEGQDLRIIVINGEVVAAAVRKQAEITGTGKHTVKQLIERLSRRRSAATGGESVIPMDAETERCVHTAGYEFESTLEEGKVLTVRKAANLHTGGTIHDVTEELHPTLAEAAARGAKALEIPVVGFDFLVPSVHSEEYVIIEANERPGLANHEPAPTARRFIDFLFPQSVEAPVKS